MVGFAVSCVKTSEPQNATLHSGLLLATENNLSSCSGLRAVPMSLVVVEQLHKLT